MEPVDPRALALVARLGHDLRTPLTSIVGFSQLLLEGTAGPLNAEQEEWIQDIHAVAEHMHSLIEQLMDLSKARQGQLSIRMDDMDLAELIEECVRSLQPQLKAGRLRIEWNVEAEVREIVADPFRMRQVVLNYLANAVKFSPPEGTIRVHAHPFEQGRVCLYVQDEGPGIELERQHALFVEYSQVDSDAERARRGTGIGLALVKAIVEAHGGEVGVSSAPGQGSTFRAVLPREPGQQARDGLA